MLDKIYQDLQNINKKTSQIFVPERIDEHKLKLSSTASQLNGSLEKQSTQIIENKLLSLSTLQATQSKAQSLNQSASLR